MLKTIVAASLILQSSLVLAESGLKKVSYENETADLNSANGTGKDAGSLSPEQLAKIKAEVDLIKAKQIESQKALEELDKED